MPTHPNRPTTQPTTRSLFEKDKLLFAFTLAVKLKLNNGGLITQGELRFLQTGVRGGLAVGAVCSSVHLTALGRFSVTGAPITIPLHPLGGVALGELPLPNPAPDWLSHKAWGELCCASALGGAWEGLAAHVAEHPVEWRLLFDSASPQAEELPEPWQAQLGPFQRLLLLRALRQDKLTQGVSQYVADTMGRCGGVAVRPGQARLALPHAATLRSPSCHDAPPPCPPTQAFC